LPDCNGFALDFAMPKEKNWLQRRLIEPLLSLLRQGMSPARLALCVAIGIVIGNIPILGVSTIICTFIALIFRLNLPTMQLVQGAMAPTQVLLIIPFVRVGEWILRVPPQALSMKSALELMAQGLGHAVVVLRDAIFHGFLAWALTAPFFIYFFYRLFTPLFEKAALQMNARTSRDA
jgi:uncharacterized protein (DUF2062 family)